MLNVLVVTPIYPWPGDPPEGIFVHRQIVNLVRQGVRCRVLTFRPAPPGVPPLFAEFAGWRYGLQWLGRDRALDGVPVEHVFYPQPWKRGADLIPIIGNVLARHIEADPSFVETDVIYAHWLWRGGAAALELRERFGWPVAAIARGSDMHWWQEVHPHCRPHVKRVIRQADLVLANCHGLRRSAEKMVPEAEGQINVIYNGCDTGLFRPAEDKAAVRRTLGLPEDERLLLFCGSVIERKGVRELADAWRCFAVAHLEWRLVVVGRLADEHLLRYLRRAASKRIILVGQIPAAQVPQYMQAADAYVQPSRLEGLANATMEAMASALPVVATDTGGQSEAITNGETGRLVPPNNAKALCQALAAVAASPRKAQRMAVSARAKILTDFDAQRHAGRLKAVLQRAAKSGERRFSVPSAGG